VAGHAAHRFGEVFAVAAPRCPYDARMHPANGQPRKALQTNRPWLTVAGCLGSGFLGVALIAVAAIAVVVVVVFFPHWLPGGPSGG